MFPISSRCKHDDDPDKCLLESGTTPNNASTCTRSKMDGAGFEEGCRVVGELYEPEDHMCNMCSHKVKWRCDIHAEPSDLNTSFVAKDSKFPKEISRKQSNDE